MSRYNVEECEAYKQILHEKSRELVQKKAAIGAAKGDYSAEQFKLTEEEVEAMNLPPQPKGYREFLEDKGAGQVDNEERPVHRAPVSRRPSFLDEYRHKLIFGAIVVVAVVLLYYVVSPYQNCVREYTAKSKNELKARLVCGQRNTW